MSDRTKSILSLLASLALGGVLLWLALRNADLQAVGQALAEGAWGWMVPFVFLGLASVVIRAWRWGLLIESLPEQTTPVPLRLTSASVVIGYLVNYAAPRLGEVARTANVARRSSATFSGVLGTVVAERVLDVIGLALALASVAVLFGDRVRSLLTDAAANIAAMIASIPPWMLVAAALGVIAVLIGAGLLLRRGRGRMTDILASFRDGLASVVRTGRPGAVVVSTVALWGCYGLMADLPLRLLGLDASYGLGFLEAWAVMAIGGIGMALPSPGGTGSFHYATVQALTLLFGVAVTPAATYALLVHAAGVVFYCVLGLVALGLQGTSVRAVTETARDTS